jgi:hypothetical protein
MHAFAGNIFHGVDGVSKLEQVRGLFRCVVAHIDTSRCEGMKLNTTGCYSRFLRRENSYRTNFFSACVLSYSANLMSIPSHKKPMFCVPCRTALEQLDRKESALAPKANFTPLTS